MENNVGPAGNSRREFLGKVGKAAAVTPAVGLLLSSNVLPAHAVPHYAKGNNGVGNGLDPQPPGNPKPNDLPGTGPGNPGGK